MRILVVDIAAIYGGAFAVLEDFYTFVKNNETCRGHEWQFLISSKVTLQEDKHISVLRVSNQRFKWLYRLFFEKVKIKKYINKFNPNVIISFQNTLTKFKNIRSAVYIHQSIPFQNSKKFSFFKKSEFFYAIYQYVIGGLICNSARQVDQVFVQTEWMKKSVALKSKCSESKIIVVPVSSKQTMDIKDGVEFSRLDFFYPAFESIYKNQRVIEDAADILLQKGYRNISISLTTARQYDNELVHGIGRVSRSEVIKRLQQSTLIFPSYIETVGLPLMEAKGTGTIILAADCEYAHETLNGYENAYFFNPFSANELANLIESVACGILSRKKIKNNIRMPQKTWEPLVNAILNN